MINYETLINQAAGLIIPEIILLATVCVMLLAAPFMVSETGVAPSGLRHRWGILVLLALSVATLTWFRTSPSTESVTSGPFRSDEFVWFIRGISLAAGFLLTLILWDQIDDAHAAEAHACLLAILCGVNFTAISNDLVTLFLGLELVSIPTYISLILPRRDWNASEATIKYFLLSIFSSAIVLYGFSWIYGLAGTTSLPAIAERMAAGASGAHRGMYLLALVFVTLGISFRLTAVPFHFYAPDVFQGITPPSAAMLSFIPKVVGFSALLRLLPFCAGNVGGLTDWTPEGPLKAILTVIAVLTMLTGNLLAIRQSNILRMMAYSSIAHAGYMLVGLTMGDTPGSTSGIASLLFYLSVYGVMTVGVFALLTAASSVRKPIRTLSELAGLSRTRPAAAFMMSVCLFGLSGLPPTGGFLGKLNLFFSAWSSGSQHGKILAAVLAVNAVIAASYYLRLIAAMYLEPSSGEDTRSEAQPAAFVAGMVCASATLAIFALPQWLWDAALHAAG
ncbi:MAG: NADH-quinone oxidoreductase subunit N [Planctomyces sp.]